MCMSRLRRVTELLQDGRVAVCDLDEHEQTVSLLAYDGPEPEVGDWLVVHSGFALAPAAGHDAEVALQELRTIHSQDERDRRVP